MKLVALALSAALAAQLWTGLAWARTKYQANLVPASASPPALSNKSKLQAKDNGSFKASLKGVTDATGALVTTDRLFRKTNTLSGDEYVTVLKGTFTALGLDFEFNLVSELKKGSGTGKVNGAPLFALIPAGLHRAIEIRGAEVHGPIGATNAAACLTNLNSGGFVLLGNPNPCVGGDLIGVGGIQIPQ